MFEYTLSWLVTILLVNIVLLYFAWQTYGQRINVTILKKEEKDLIFGLLICRLFDLYKLCQQNGFLFVDQLRKEALELKLPKEHTPRI